MAHLEVMDSEQKIITENLWKCSGKQDRKYTCNVTSGRVRANILVVGKKYVIHILSVCVCVS